MAALEPPRGRDAGEAQAPPDASGPPPFTPGADALRFAPGQLDAARLEALGIEVAPTSKPDEVAALLRSVMASHRDPAAAAGVALTLDAPDGPVTLRADADQLVQVFHNLIENAL
ncbi:MAG: hypothetical protein CVU56_00005, partial [Deltaproteobacteria bacterium HGW-Deltaproteobacteria-14]